MGSQMAVPTHSGVHTALRYAQPAYDNESWDKQS